MQNQKLDLSYTSLSVTAANISGMLGNKQFEDAPLVGSMLNLLYMNSTPLFLCYVLTIESDDPLKKISLIWVPSFQGHVVADYFKVRFVQNACAYVAAPNRYSPDTMNYMQGAGADSSNQYTIMFTGGTGLDVDIYRIILVMKDFIRQNQYLTPASQGCQALRYMRDASANVGLLDLACFVQAQHNADAFINDRITLTTQDLKTLEVACVDGAEAARVMLNINYVFEKRGTWPGVYGPSALKPPQYSSHLPQRQPGNPVAPDLWPRLDDEGLLRREDPPLGTRKVY